MPYVKPQCCRIACTCSGAALSSDATPCGCAAASSKFCVLGLPYEPSRKAGFSENTTPRHDELVANLKTFTEGLTWDRIYTPARHQLRSGTYSPIFDNAVAKRFTTATSDGCESSNP